MSTVNNRALERLEKKLTERLERIKADAFGSSEFPQFKEYVGIKKGIELALEDLREVDEEFKS